MGVTCSTPMQHLESNFKVPPLCARAPNEKLLLFSCSTTLALSKSQPSRENKLGWGQKPSRGGGVAAGRPCLSPAGPPHLPAWQAGETNAASMPGKHCQSPPKTRGRLKMGLAPRYFYSLSCYSCPPVTFPLVCRITRVFSGVCLSPDSSRSSFSLRSFRVT